MLEPERKLYQPKAALRMHLNPACSVHWLIQEGDRDADIDIVSLVPPSATRAAMFSRVCVSLCGTRHRVIIRVRKRRYTDKNKDIIARALRMHNGVRIVGGQGFNRKYTLGVIAVMRSEVILNNIQREGGNEGWNGGKGGCSWQRKEGGMSACSISTARHEGPLLVV